jgi:hypothetical protein
MSDAPIEEQQHTSAGRTIRLDVDPHAVAPVDPIVLGTAGPVIQAGTPPDFVTSPMRADGLTPTSGVMFTLKSPANGIPGQPAAEAIDPAGFLVTVWVRDSVTRNWAATSQIQVPYDEWVSSFDFNGGDLYFQLGGVDNTGVGAIIDIIVVEL